MTTGAEPADANAIRLQVGQAYDYFSGDERRRHVQMLQSVKSVEDVAVHTKPRDNGEWTVTVSTSDCVGALSIISGLLAAYCWDILRAHIFTLDFTPSTSGLQRPGRRNRSLLRHKGKNQTPPRRKILDVLEVRGIDSVRPLPWDQFQEELAQLMGMLAQGKEKEALDLVIERFAGTIGHVEGAGAQLLPIDVDLSSDPSSEHTVLKIRSADTPGFLFAFTHALALIAINIVRAQVTTVYGEVHDTFWLTERNGRKIERPERFSELRIATALIKEFTYLLPRSPNPAQAIRQFNALIHQLISHSDWTDNLRNLESASVMETLADLMGISQFLWEDFLRMQHENLFPVLIDMPALDESRSLEQLRQSIQEELSETEDLQEKARELNRFKDREMFRIDLRHITRRTDFQEFSAELSDLAQAVVSATADLAHQELQPRSGTPHLTNGTTCPWCICALGKFGGRELGYGSDIEMVTIYRDEGLTDGTTPIENSRYFGDFVRACLSILSTHREGIFEIDFRLRPYGNAGPLASTLDGFKQYYTADGDARQFERLALVKLRPVAGDSVLGQLVLDARDAYVYSGKPLDLDNIRHLRYRQATELVPAGEVSAKHSPGGLVDVEYFVQACQVTAGSTDPSVRVSNTLRAIDRLIGGGHLPRKLASDLIESYGFLRRLIDALRVVRGHARDLTIPDRDSREFAYLARRLQFNSPYQLNQAILAHMDFAQGLWDLKILSAE